ncbi:MAG TPA: methyltransferase domain-containing protein [Ilumatobacteraceae bacterium]|nr:methyltransferase domain-containing protein [Ilumatobacteraceae bacterium]
MEQATAVDDLHHYLLDNRADETEHRFGALAELFDQNTFRHLDAVGVGPGWRCWEVGAGGPSVANWLAERVGPSGYVVATDIDLSWLPESEAVRFEARRLDVAADDPPADGFDLVHARLVLVHVRERDEALRKMAAALRPGGWLVIEDFDVALQQRAVIDASRPDHYVANRIRAGFVALLAQRGVDLEYGRKLPRLLREVGLSDVTADAYMPVALPAAAALDEANVHQVRDALIGQWHATPAEISVHLDTLRRGALDLATPPMISARGRQPRATRPR